MTRTSRAERIKRVQRWRESKLSAEAFAAQLGINAVRLRYWDWKALRPLSRQRSTRDPHFSWRSPHAVNG
jgi:hypothetical protein